MDGIVGWVSALGPSGWQNGKVFSEVLRWNLAEANIQMKTPCAAARIALFKLVKLWYNMCSELPLTGF